MRAVSAAAPGRDVANPLSWPTWLQAGAALLLGGLSSFAFAPYGFWWLLPPLLALLFGLVRGASPRRAGALGWLFGLGGFTSGVYWVYISTHVYGGAPAFVSVAMLVALVSYLALYPALVLWLFTRWRLGHVRGGWLALPALWLLSECARGWVLTGFPWLSLGYAVSDSLLARWAPVVGVHGISALLVLSACALLRLFDRAVATPQRAGYAVIALLPLCAAWVLPAASSWTRPSGASMSVAIVQGNVPQDEKWVAELIRPAIERYLRMTETVMGTELIVWPEVALAGSYERLNAPVLAPLAARAQVAGSTVLAGLIIGKEQGRGHYNGLQALGVGHGRYYKRHLVPFGEYFPIPDALRPLMDLIGTPYDDLLSGPSEQSPIQVGNNRLGLSICFEDVFGREMRHGVPEQDVLVNLTNDAWFEGSVAPQQHLQIARLRALELGRGLLRAANTGISAIIDADGRVVDQLDWGQTAVLRGSVRPRTGQTPYVRFGDWPLAVIALLLVGGLWWRGRRA